MAERDDKQKVSTTGRLSAKRRKSTKILKRGVKLGENKEKPLSRRKYGEIDSQRKKQTASLPQSNQCGEKNEGWQTKEWEQIERPRARHSRVWWNCIHGHPMPGSIAEALQGNRPKNWEALWRLMVDQSSTSPATNRRRGQLPRPTDKKRRHEGMMEKVSSILEWRIGTPRDKGMSWLFGRNEDR